MTALLDGSFLIAATFQDHTHNVAADRWLQRSGERYATCPITQGAVVRAAFRQGFTAVDATAILDSIMSGERHDFWVDDIGFGQVRMDGVVGHRQVTDAYLAQLAREHDGRLVTFDRGLAALHSDVAELVPT